MTGGVISLGGGVISLGGGVISLGGGVVGFGGGGFFITAHFSYLNTKKSYAARSHLTKQLRFGCLDLTISGDGGDSEFLQHMNFDKTIDKERYTISSYSPVKSHSCLFLSWDRV
ncbi:hypothetical protein F8M41_013460 [Gigaspora margarita]|uniref:Uncharacterized protein n=1 Tax=Gigaspora margarita TaxID=4874 RepID=A0A8H4ASA0_GIGMA|nr:hypothetical protein F8M41_013460 [Gigaspora margarita]